MTSAAGLESLLTLQEHDAALDRLRHRRDTLPERDAVAARRGGRSARSPREIGTLTAQRDELAHEEKRLDDEASSLREKAAEVEAKMYSGSVSSPRELQAMQADVEQLRRHQRNLESRELELMEALRAARRRPRASSTRNARRSSRELERGARDARARRGRDRPGDGRGAQGARRDWRASSSPRSSRTTSGGGRGRRASGVARLVGNTCQGCHLTIPATEVDSIRRAPEGTISYCDNCGCILVP